MAIIRVCSEHYDTEFSVENNNQIFKAGSLVMMKPANYESHEGKVFKVLGVSTNRPRGTFAALLVEHNRVRYVFFAKRLKVIYG